MRGMGVNMPAVSAHTRPWLSVVMDVGHGLAASCSLVVGWVQPYIKQSRARDREKKAAAACHGAVCSDASGQTRWLYSEQTCRMGALALFRPLSGVWLST